MSPGVGADVESLCSKCGDVWHVVVAKVGEAIVKVQCKECGGYHRHRSPDGKATPTARKSRATGSGTPRRTMRAATSPPVVIADPSLPARPYSMRETFQPGEQIAHPSFGVGVVERSSEPGKMSVRFADGARVLAQAKPNSSLEDANRMMPAPVVINDTDEP